MQVNRAGAMGEIKNIVDLGEPTREALVSELARLTEAYRVLAERHDEAAEKARLVHELEVHQVELETQNRELRAIHEALERSRSRFSRLYDFAPVAYLTLDAKGLVLDVNLSGAAMFGRDRGSLVGKPLVAVTKLDDATSLFRHLERTAADGHATSDLEFEVAGRQIQVQAVSARDLASEGGISFLTALVDVGERKRAEELVAAAHRSEQRLRARLETLASAQMAISVALTQGMDAVLEAIAEQARHVADADLAVLGIGVAEDGRFEQVVQSGRAREDAAGLLQRVGHEQAIGIADGSLLAVPVRYRDQLFGTIVLVDRRNMAGFDIDDQRFVALLAERAAVAIEVARQRAFLQSVIDQVPEGIVVSDASGRLVTMNARAREFSIPETGEVSPFGDPLVFDVRLSSGEPSPWEEIPLVRAVLHGEKVVGTELAVATREGRLVPIMASAAPIVDDRGSRVGAVAAWRDVTMIKDHERDLRHARDTAEAATDLLVHLAHSLTQLGHLEGIPKFLVDAAVEHLGADAAAVLAMTPRGDLEVAASRNLPGTIGQFRAAPDVIGPELVSRLVTACGSDLPTGRAFPLAIGGELHAVLVLLFERDAGLSQERFGLVAGLVDLAATAFADAQREAQLAAVRETMIRTEKLRALGQLAAGVSHDLKNMLSPLWLHADFLEQAIPVDAPAREALPRLRRVLKRALDTVERLRAFGRQESMPGESVDLNEIVQECAGLTAGRRRPPQKKIELRVELGNPPRVVAEPSELVTSVLNLLVNAFDALPGGGVVIARTGEDAGGGWVEIEDDGPGIPPELQPRVFDPSFSTKGTGGTGLGLAMVYAFVRRHGGQVTLDSATDHGARFRIWLPRAESPAP